MGHLVSLRGVIEIIDSIRYDLSSKVYSVFFPVVFGPFQLVYLKVELASVSRHIFAIIVNSSFRCHWIFFVLIIQIAWDHNHTTH